MEIVSDEEPEGVTYSPVEAIFSPMPSQYDIALAASVCATAAVATQCHELASGKRNM